MKEIVTVEIKEVNDMFDLTPFVLIAGVFVGIITAVVQMIKTSSEVPNKFVPLISCAVGVVVGLVAKEFTVYSYSIMAITGFVAGLASCGLFDLTKVTKKKNC